MNTCITTALAAVALAAALPAQYGFLSVISGPSGNQINGGCGFNCADPANVVQVTAPAGDQLTYQIQGDAGALGALMVSVMPAVPACPGIAFGGVGNSLLLNPAPSFTFLVSLDLSLMSLATTSCTATGGDRILQNFTLPTALTGATLAFQGFAVAGGVPTFTRALEVTIQ